MSCRMAHWGDAEKSMAGESQAQPLDIVGNLFRDGFQLAQQVMAPFV